MATRIKQSVLEELKDKKNRQIILDICAITGRQENTVRTIWLENNSEMLTMYDVYSIIQKGLGKSDKEMFERFDFKIF